MADISLTGETQARVFDFLRIKTAIRLEMKGLKFSQGSALQAAKMKGYVPSWVRYRKDALPYMEYVTTLLTAGGVAKQLGEEIATGKLTYAGKETCGCPIFQLSDKGSSEFLSTSADLLTMCIHQEMTEGN